MNRIRTVGEVFDAIQKAKAGASDFRTNFFPSQTKLQGWIDHGEFFSDLHTGATFFFRKDRDFWHFHFCAASLPVLQQSTAALATLKTARVVADLVGNETALGELLTSLEAVGFRRYAKLRRMASVEPCNKLKSATNDLPIVCAEASDCPAVLELTESLFDRFSDQLPMLYEIEAAVANRQILVVRRDGVLAGLLFFETQGLASTVRFWAVAKKFRTLGAGSALMQHYLNNQSGVRRFTLWVNASNQNAIQKYGHYSYAPDGLVDHVLANQMVHA